MDDPNQPDWAKFKTLREIEMIRETKKDVVINRVLNDYISDAIQLNVIPGELTFFTLPIHNKFNQNEVYSVHIKDPDESFLASKEIMLVNNSVEWRYWAQQGKCKKPD